MESEEKAASAIPVTPASGLWVRLSALSSAVKVVLAVAVESVA